MAKDYDTATAPYNFVSLPQGVLTSPIEGDAMSDAERVENYRAHVLAKGRLSGRIDLEIKTLTPVFIGTGVDAGNAVENFFAPTGIPIIPGSSLRGMIKNLFKIVTCSAMRAGEDYHDQVLYFRTMADKKDNMRKLYTTEMATTVRKGTNTISETKAEAGYLVQQTGDDGYYICPAEFDIMNYGGGRQPENEVRWGEPGSGRADCHTGRMSKKGTYTRHRDPDWTQRIPVPDNVVRAYREDSSRKGVELLDEEKGNFCAKKGNAAASFTGWDDIRFVAPCFYKTDAQGEIAHFGFGRFYRIAYHMSIGDHVLRMESDRIDYTDALFGRREEREHARVGREQTNRRSGCKELWASRLAFADAVPKETPRTEAPHFPQILSAPKPTAVQLYLEQKNGADRLAHWDSAGVPIRGYKLYWHQKNGTAWMNREQDQPNTQTKCKIQPVAAGNTFYGSIRFERLSEDELGALLKVLCLCDGHLLCKIGKGKPIGLGSIEIIPRLFLTDTEDSYHSAFDGAGGWNTAERGTEMNAYIQAFERELDRLGKDVRARYDKAQKELVHLLRWDHTKNPKWEEKIAQMTIGQGDRRFQGRAILPTALDVKETLIK